MRLTYSEAKQKIGELQNAIAQAYLRSELLASETPDTQMKLTKIQGLLREAVHVSCELEAAPGGELESHAL